MFKVAYIEQVHGSIHDIQLLLNIVIYNRFH